jgi:mannose-6-phosphate isomerase-like protein (cupin superfamily)
LVDEGAKPIRSGDVFVLPEGTSHDLRNTGSEDLRIIAFFSKPQVEQHWDVDTWPPDNSKVTGSPNRD